MSIISTESLSKVYGKKHKKVSGLTDVTFSVLPGEFIAVTGPSGSGKTTLLLSLGGLIKPTSGKVLIRDKSIYDFCPKERIKLRKSEIGFLFQTFNLIPYLTALENVEIPLMISGKPHKEQREKATELLERVGLGERLNHKPSELSIGQQQRVALARTLVNGASIILADEPTGNLDPATARGVIGMFKELNEEKFTIIMVTHDPRIAQEASSVLEIVDGKINSRSTCRSG